MKESLGCMYCSFICTSKERQVAHYIEMHSNKVDSMFKQGKHICIVCGEKFRTNEGLEHHSNTEHQKKLI